MKSKKAAMEMSVGTIVTIVLLMSVLILGVVLVKNIYDSATNAIDVIDKSLTDEMSKLFSQDTSKKIIIFPPSRKIDIEKGEQGYGFAFSIRNVDNEEGIFSYEVSAGETDCSSLSVEDAGDFLGLGKSGEVNIAASSVMENPKLVTFNIPETAPGCSVSYLVDLKKDGETYGSTVDVILNIKAK